MQAVIMAAGIGKRLRPLTLTTPKPLLQVGGRTILDRTLEALPKSIDEVILVVGYRADQIREQIGNHAYGHTIRYVVHETIDGTAKVVHACRDIIHGRFMVVSGDDIYVAEDLARLAECPLGILMSTDATYAARLGLCSTQVDGSLKGIVEKDSPEHARLLAEKKCLVNCGAYLLDERYFDVEPVKLKSGEYGLPQTLVSLVASGVRIDVVTATFWIPIGTPEELTAADTLVRSRE